MPTGVKLPLTDKRILVLEDEPLIAMDIEHILRDAGASKVALCTALDAEELQRFASYDAAVLDLNIGGTSSFPVAEALKRHAIPFIFVSGSQVSSESPILNDVAVVSKPFDRDDLVQSLCAEMLRFLERRAIRV